MKLRLAHLLTLLALSPAVAALSQEKPIRVDAGQFDSLQAAIDALPASGGVVSIPPGTYEISQPLLVTTPDTRIAGAGRATHIKNTNTKGQPAIVLRPANRKDDSKKRIWRLELTGFRVSGNPQSGDGVHAEGIDELFIHGLAVDHHGGDGIALVDCYEDPRICDSILTYNKDAGLSLKVCHDIVVSANQFEANQDALTCRDSFNLCMTGNNLDDHRGNGVIIENTYGSVVSGNMIEECQGTAIILDRDCYGVTLSANVIAHEMSGGIDLRDAHGCAVSANTFVIVHKFGVRVRPTSGRITISANNFSNSYIGDGKTKRPTDAEQPIQRDSGVGVVLETASFVTITGNTFAGMNAEAILGQGACRDILVVGNVIAVWGRQTDRKNVAPIAITGTEILVKNNPIGPHFYPQDTTPQTGP